MVAEPRYNIRAVERLTGVPAPTLRSWERRYGFPAPSRTLSAHRLYSDEDIRAIRWVRSQTERGLSVAQAIEWAQQGGEDHATALSGLTTAPSPESLARAQVEAVHRYDEAGVEAALTAALAHYPADRVLLDVITPALVEVGEQWARGELSVAGEHFFSNIIRRRLLGLLMLALFLRWAGARVLYLGADLPVQDLIRLTRTRDVDVLCLSAGSEASWADLEAVVKELRDRTPPVAIYLGGAAAPDIAAPQGVHVLTTPLPEAATTIVTGRRG